MSGIVVHERQDLLPDQTFPSKAEAYEWIRRQFADGAAYVFETAKGAAAPPVEDWTT